jgi:transcriptional regulator with XRE-family HTH domain
MTYPLGENIARLRTARQLTQEQLADVSGVSVDTISRLERGSRSTARPATLSRLAGALHVDLLALLGVQPAEQLSEDADHLRRAVRALDLPEFADAVEVLPLPDLQAAAGSAWRDYIAGQHRTLLATLPALMVDTRRAVRASSGDAAAQAAELLCTSYRLAAGLAGRIGLTDLAMHAAHRALDIARSTTRPELDEAAAIRYLVWVLIRQGDLEEAERIAVRAAERLDPGLMAAGRGHDEMAVFGNLLFNAASAAARGGREDRAEELLTVARAAAVRTGAEHVSELGIFGPRVAAIQHVDQTVRAGDSDRALELATHLPDGQAPAFWEAGHRLHLAAAAADLREYGDALSHLSTARDIAPDWVRLQPLGVAVAGDLAEHYPRRRTAEATAILTHYMHPTSANGETN